MDKVSRILRTLLVVFLFAIPIALAMVVWFTPVIDSNQVLVALSAINLPLSLAEIMFLVRAVIFPRDGRKWWKEM